MKNYTTIKACNVLSKIFSATKLNGYNESDKITEPNEGLMDCAHAAMIIPKTHTFKASLAAAFVPSDADPKEYWKAAPALSYAPKSLNNGETVPLESTSRYSSEYLLYVLEICKAYKYVSISVAHNYPMRVETEDFIFMLAPRVDKD